MTPLKERQLEHRLQSYIDMLTACEPDELWRAQTVAADLTALLDRKGWG